MAVQSTKSRIPTLVKRSGGSTVEELVSALEAALLNGSEIEGLSSQ